MSDLDDSYYSGNISSECSSTQLTVASDAIKEKKDTAESVVQMTTSPQGLPTSGSSAPGFVEAISKFSDIVSQMQEPFEVKLSRLLTLASVYLQSSAELFATASQKGFAVIECNGLSLDKGTLLSSHAPMLQSSQEWQLPTLTALTSADQKVFQTESTHAVFCPVYIDRVPRLALIFFLPYIESLSDEQALFVKMFARYIGNEASRTEVRAALNYRIAFEQLLTDISRSFIHVEEEHIDTTVRKALRRIAAFADVDTSYILLFRDDHSRIEVTHWWMSSGRNPDFPLKDISVDLFQWSLGRILKGEVVVMPEHHELPIEAESERQFIKLQGFKTAILAPLAYRGEIIGVVGFASTARQFDVDRDTVQLLEMVGDTLASVMVLREARLRVQILEDQVRHSQKLESLGVLAGGIAHDFNNLLMGVLGNAGIALQDRTLAEETRLAVERVERIATHAGELTNQLLAYSGRGKFVVESVNLSDIASKMSDLLLTVVSKRHSLSTNFASDLPVVEVDVAQVSQVVMNLITNASEAIGDTNGAIVLSTGLLSVSKTSLYEGYYSNDTADGVYVYLRVSDTGCGMDKETRGKIFDPFYSTKFTGRGLGLAAVLGIVRSHGGTIRVDSELGEGTTFTVMLPCAPQQEIITSASEPISVKQQNPMQVLQGAGILVVDDEASIRIVLQSILERFGCTVFAAADGKQALECFSARQNEIEACIIDMTMPDMTGHELARRLQQMQRTLPVVLTSGYSEQEMKKHCETLTDTTFLQKPFHPQVLVKELIALIA